MRWGFQYLGNWSLKSIRWLFLKKIFHFLNAKQPRNESSFLKIESFTLRRSFCKIFTPSLKSLGESYCVCSGHVLTCRSGCKPYMHTDSRREKFFHSDTEPRCSLSLDPSLLTPFLLLPLSPPLFFPFALSLSYKDTCIPSHSMRSILPWSCNFPPLLPQGSPHFQHSQTSSLSLPFPDKLSHTAQCVYVYVRVCGVRWIRTCAGRRGQWILQAVFQLLC